MRPKNPTYINILKLWDVLEGDYIKYINKDGPHYLSKVVSIEYISNTMIRVLTERGEFIGYEYQDVHVMCKDAGPRDKSGK